MLAFSVIILRPVMSVIDIVADSVVAAFMFIVKEPLLTGFG